MEGVRVSGVLGQVGLTAVHHLTVDQNTGTWGGR
jgi:hypothetical protein